MNDSTIKTVIDEWYSENMTAYTNKLEDTIWCNDRSVVQDSDFTGTGIGKEVTMYGSRNRLYVSNQPSLECKSENDRFTVSEENGNGALTYPIALLTADEMAYAGATTGDSNNNSNRTYYLYNGDYWWSLSPYSFYGSVAGVFRMRSEGNLYNHYLDSTSGVRPSISLKKGIKVQSGGDGTTTNPYVIE